MYMYKTSSHMRVSVLWGFFFATWKLLLSVHWLYSYKLQNNFIIIIILRYLCYFCFVLQFFLYIFVVVASSFVFFLKLFKTLCHDNNFFLTIIWKLMQQLLQRLFLLFIFVVFVVLFWFIAKFTEYKLVWGFLLGNLTKGTRQWVEVISFELTFHKLRLRFLRNELGKK